MMNKPNILTFLVFFLSLCTYAIGQGIWQADSETTSAGVIIQNGLPKGGGSLDLSGTIGYTDFMGRRFAHAIFWTRVVNETATPFTLAINFPSDSFAISSSPDSYVKIFLPPGAMTLDKQSLYNYGLTGLKSFLDTGFYKPTGLQRTINPKEECVFYVAALGHGEGGGVRAGLVLKEQELFYRIRIVPIGSALIPCGKIVFKN
jgi:hypothetical protein